MGKRKSYIGERFSNLVVIFEDDDRVLPCGRAERYVLVRCDCGNVKSVNLGHLRRGNIKSCGCYKNTFIGLANSKHGMRDTREYMAWCNMRRRCTEVSNIGYKHYGGRGISVCKEWMISFENFYEDMGPCPPGYTLERINNNGDYMPENCVWRTQKEQQRNRRNNRLIMYNNECYNVAEWAEIVGLPYKTLHYRIQAGWSIERAFITPLRKLRRKS